MSINYNTNIGSIFHNNNGTDYVILAEKPEKDYTMLLNMKNKVTPFVCAWNLNKERGEWSQGHYFGTIEEAMEYWEEV